MRMRVDDSHLLRALNKTSRCRRHPRRAWPRSRTSRRLNTTKQSPQPFPLLPPTGSFNIWIHHLQAGEPGTHHVHPNSLPPVVNRGGFRKPNHAEFTGTISRVANIAGISYFMHIHTLLRLRFITVSQSASAISATGVITGPTIPALFTAQSRRPNLPSAPSTIASISAPFATSV